MKIEFEGVTRKLDVDDLSVKQAVAITEYTGGTLVTWEKTAADPELPGWLRAMEALYWLMLAQNGETTDPDPGGSDFAVLKFSRAFAKATAEEEKTAGGEAADPTKPAGTPDGAPAMTPATATG